MATFESRSKEFIFRPTVLTSVEGLEEVDTVYDHLNRGERITIYPASD